MSKQDLQSSLSVEKYLHLVEPIAKKYFHSGCDRAALIAAGEDGLIAAIKNHNPEKGVFEHFANKHIKFAVLNCLKKSKNFGVTYIPKTQKSGFYVDTLEINNRLNCVSGSEDPDDFDADLFEGLTLKQKELLWLHYVEGVSQAEIARRLRTPKGTIAAQIRRGRRLIQKKSRQPLFEAQRDAEKVLLKKLEVLRNIEREKFDLSRSERLEMQLNNALTREKFLKGKLDRRK